MKHPISDNWPFHNYRAFIIYNKKSMMSRWSVNRAQSTAKRCGINAELFDGVHKDDSTRVMKKFGLDWHPMAHEWGHRVHHMESVAGCFLSHFSLWKKCVELKEPIVILEHDVEFSSHIQFPKEHIDFDGIVNIGQPIWGVWWEDPLNKPKEESELLLRDVSKCEKPHAPYGIFDQDRIEYCDCERNFLIGAHSYIITPNAAKKLIEKAKEQGIDRADVFIDSQNNNVADLLPFPASQIRRFSLIDRGWKNTWHDSEYMLPIYEQDAVYHNDEIVLPCSPKWDEWLKFKKKYPDIFNSLIEAQNLTKKALRFGKIIFDNKEVIKGEKDGLFKDYYDDGESLRCEGVIQDGEMHGEWVYYLIDGTVDSKYYLDMGKLTRMDRHSWRPGQK